MNIHTVAAILVCFFSMVFFLLGVTTPATVGQVTDVLYQYTSETPRTFQTKESIWLNTSVSCKNKGIFQKVWRYSPDTNQVVTVTHNVTGGYLGRPEYHGETGPDSHQGFKNFKIGLDIPVRLYCDDKGRVKSQKVRLISINWPSFVFFLGRN